MNIYSLSRWSRRHLPASADQVIRDMALRRGHRSYSQEGEDLILRRYFEARPPGFFVDIGAHHPFRFSNTYLSYLSGWRGINVDAMPGSMRLFRKHRPRDISIEAGVGSQPGEMPFYVCSDAALNTFDAHLARQRESAMNRIVRIEPVKIMTLDQILDQHLPSGQPISFLSVDVEGRDLDVLESKSWDRDRPEIVIVETTSPDIPALMSDACAAFLGTVGYVPFAKAVHSSFFVNVEVSPR